MAHSVEATLAELHTLEAERKPAVFDDILEARIQALRHEHADALAARLAEVDLLTWVPGGA